MSTPHQSSLPRRPSASRNRTAIFRQENAASSCLNGAVSQPAANADPRPPIAENADNLARCLTLRRLCAQVQVPEAHRDDLLVGKVPPVTPPIAPLLAGRVGGLPVQLHANQVILVKIVQVNTSADARDTRLPRGNRKAMPTLDAA